MIKKAFLIDGELRTGVSDASSVAEDSWNEIVITYYFGKYHNVHLSIIYGNH